MKTMLHMKAVGILMILMAIAFSGHSQANLRTGPAIPEYKNTGNPGADQAKYAQDKQAWITAHSAEYQAYLTTLQKQAPVKENSTAYVNTPWKSVDEKDKMIAQNPAKYKAETTQLPTGKVKIDKRDFDRLDAKTKADILANPDHYEVITNLNPTYSSPKL